MARTVNMTVRPKRRIEQVISSDPSDDVTNTQSHVILHTADDRKTLVRVVGRITLCMKGNPGAGTLGVAAVGLQVAPNGTTISVTNPNSSSLDAAKPKAQMAQWLVAQLGSGAVATDAPTVHVIDVDIKGQRIMDVGDELTLSHRANAASLFTLTYSLTAIFKE